MGVVELAAGPVEYLDTGGDGPVIVLAHGVPMDHRAWSDVIPRLDGFRVIAPTLPLGGHRRPMRPDADLSQRGQAHIVADLLRTLDVHDVTLVLNDWGGGQFMINDGLTDRVGRLALATCEAFDNFPPRPARVMSLAARVPGGFWLLLQLMRSRAFCRASYGPMSVAGLDPELVRDWFTPALTDAGVRRDFAAFARGNPSPAEQRDLASGWATFTRPVLVVWGDDDTLMPADHAARLAQLYPDARLIRLAQCSTLVGIDQPERIAELLREFVGEASRDG